MAKAIVGVIGGSGVYRLEGMTDVRSSDRDALGRAVRRPALWPCRRHGGGVPRPPRPGPSLLARHDQLPRQHRRAEARRRHRHHRGFGLRLVPARALSRPVRAGRSVRWTAPSRAQTSFLARVASPMCRWRIRPPPLLRKRIADAAEAEGVAYRIGGTYVCMEGPQFRACAESLSIRRAAPTSSA